MPRHYLQFIWFRAFAQLRSESNRAYLGYFWWILEPLLYLAVFYIVFALVLNRGDENYVRLLLIGLVVWKWLEGAVRGSMDVIAHNAGLIDKVYLPKLVLPTVIVLSSAIKFALVFSLLLLFIALAGGLSIHWLWLGILLPIQTILVLACCYLVAAVTPFLPDIRMVFDKALTFLFFLSGIFYTADAIPQQYQSYFLLNPAFNLIECYRSVLLFGKAPEWSSLIYLLLLSSILLTIGAALLRRFDRLYPRMIY